MPMTQRTRAEMLLAVAAFAPLVVAILGCNRFGGAKNDAGPTATTAAAPDPSAAKLQAASKTKMDAIHKREDDLPKEAQ